MNEPTYVVTGRGARIKHITLNDTVMCPSPADKAATGAAMNKPTCSRCQLAYEEARRSPLPATTAEETPAETETPDEPTTKPKQEAALPAEEETAAQEPARPEVSAPRTHTFDSSAEAYDASQCREDIRDGDVLVVPSESIVAILYRAWPVALTTAHGELHTLTAAAGDIEDSRYKMSVEAAAQAAARLDVELATDDDNVEIHFSSRVTAFMSRELATTYPEISRALSQPRLEKRGVGYTAYTTMPRDHAHTVLAHLKALRADLLSGKRTRGPKGGMNFQPKTVTKGIKHITADLAA